jgi:glycosyltransferase involved in cell wall biosynthesis
MKISIILCVFNPDSTIVEALRCLQRQKLGSGTSLEVILVDNGSQDASVSLEDESREALRGVDYHIITEPRLGLNYARQTGMAQSSGEILVFCDADNYLDPDYIHRCVEVFSNDPKVGFVGGRGKLPKRLENHAPDWLWSYQGSYAVGSQSDRNHEEREKEPEYLWGAGLAVRRKVLEQLQQTGWKPCLVGRQGQSHRGAGEDTELCLAGKIMGWKVAYDEDCRFIHAIEESRLNLKTLFAMQSGFGRARAVIQVYIMYSRLSEKGVIADDAINRWSMFNHLRKSFFNQLRLTFSKARNPFPAIQLIVIIIYYGQAFKELLLDHRRVHDALQTCEKLAASEKL